MVETYERIKTAFYALGRSILNDGGSIEAVGQALSTQDYQLSGGFNLK